MLDVLLKREPYYNDAVEVMNLARRKNIQEYVSASAMSDIYYIAYRQIKDKKLVEELLGKLLKIVSVAAVSEEEILKALELKWSDFEGAVQHSVALLSEMEGIITRNPKAYQEANINIWLPEKILQEFTQQR